MKNKDVTADLARRRQTEESLRQSHDQLDATLRGISDGVTVQDPTGRLIYANDAAAQITGYATAQALIEAPLPEVLAKFEVMDESGQPYPLDQLPGRIALQGQPAPQRVLRFRIRESGQERWSLVSATPVFAAPETTSPATAGEAPPVLFAINIFHDISEQMRLFESERMARLEAIQLSEQLEQRVIERTMALQSANKQLQEQAVERQEAEQKVSLLYRLSQELITSLNATEVATRALQLTMPAIGADRGQMWLLAMGDERLHLTSLAGQDTESLAAQAGVTALSLGQGLAGYVAGARVPLALSDVTSDERWLPLPALEDGICSAAALPLLVSDDLVGVLSLLSQRPAFFDEEKMLFLQAVAAPVALALQNARLYEAEREARQVADTLRNANLALSQTLDLPRVLKTVLRLLRRLVPYDSANVMLLEGADRLRVAAARGYRRWTDVKVIEEVSFDLSSHRILHSLLTGQESIVIADTALDPDWQPQPGTEHIRSWLGLPLIAGGKAIGVFSLDKREPHFYTERHVQLAEAMTTQAAIAVENARLFDQVRAGRERLRRLTQQVVSAQEEERRRLSRELHDEAGQALTGLKITLSLLEDELPAEYELVRQQMADAIQVTDMTMEQIRMMAHALRPPALDTVGLNATLEGFCRDFAHRIRLPVRFSGQELPPLASVLNVSFYRCLQEALTNVAKHAQARQVAVALDYDGKVIRLQISDDGQGFEVDSRTAGPGASGIGLLGMRERFEVLGGRLEIQSRPGDGTRLVAYAPHKAT